MPEGDRFKESRFYAMTDENTVKTGDRIDDNGRSFEIKNLQNWNTSMKALGVLID